MNDVDLSHAGFWMGHPGSLLPFHGFVAPYGVDDDDGVVIQRGMGGGVRARVPRTRAGRSWDIELPTVYPRDVKQLRTLSTATLPPYVLVTPEAQVSNVLTPERSTLGSLIQPSAGLAMGGWWPIAGQYQGGGALARLNPNAAFGNAANVFIGPCPTPPVWTGRKVTASVYLATARSAGARITLQWLDAAGNSISGSAFGNYVTGMDGLRRSTATGTPPAGAVAGRLLIQYAEVLAQPQVTWTDGPTDWDVGAGVDQVVLHGLSRTIATASPDQVLQDISFTATEVGP